MTSPSSAYRELRAAVAGLDPVEAMRATAALVETHAISWDEGQQLSSALSALRTIFRKLEISEQRSP